MVRFGAKRNFLSFLLPMVVFFIGAMFFSLFFQNYVVYNYEKMMDDDGDEPCWPEWEDRIILTNGTYMCKSEWNTYREGYSNYMTADNHYKFKEYGETSEHRWSEQDGYLFISNIPWDIDHYECYVYIRESNLPENLTGDEFWYYYHDQPDFPDWCDEIQDRWTHSTFLILQYLSTVKEYSEYMKAKENYGRLNLNNLRLMIK